MVDFGARGEQTLLSVYSAEAEELALVNTVMFNVLTGAEIDAALDVYSNQTHIRWRGGGGGGDSLGPSTTHFISAFAQGEWDRFERSQRRHGACTR